MSICQVDWLPVSAHNLWQPANERTLLDVIDHFGNTEPSCVIRSKKQQLRIKSCAWETFAFVGSASERFSSSWKVFRPTQSQNTAFDMSNRNWVNRRNKQCSENTEQIRCDWHFPSQKPQNSPPDYHIPSGVSSSESCLQRCQVGFVSSSPLIAQNPPKFIQRMAKYHS